MALPLEGKLAVVTGASSGIGEATAIALAKLGARLFVGARRIERLEALRERIVAQLPGAEVRIHTLDVTDPASCRAFCAAAEAAGEVDILVNNAGKALGSDPVVTAPEEPWREMIETNVMGLLRITRALLPGMVSRKRGTVVNVGSIAGLEPYAGGSVYCGSKAAVRSIGKAMRHELLGTNVRVCTVEPGAVETEFSEVRFGGDKARAKNVYRGFQPLTAGDIAEVIAFAVTRPPHMVLEEITVWPTAQASPTAYHREG
jgi:3-hydroxy acid dehydrogenase/malonic semialdehyde reductase